MPHLDIVSQLKNKLNNALSPLSHCLSSTTATCRAWMIFNRQLQLVNHQCNHNIFTASSIVMLHTLACEVHLAWKIRRNQSPSSTSTVVLKLQHTTNASPWQAYTNSSSPWFSSSHLTGFSSSAQDFFPTKDISFQFGHSDATCPKPWHLKHLRRFEAAMLELLELVPWSFLWRAGRGLFFGDGSIFNVELSPLDAPSFYFAQHKLLPLSCHFSTFDAN